MNGTHALGERCWDGAGTVWVHLAFCPDTGAGIVGLAWPASAEEGRALSVTAVQPRAAPRTAGRGDGGGGEAGPGPPAAPAALTPHGAQPHRLVRLHCLCIRRPCSNCTFAGISIRLSGDFFNVHRGSLYPPPARTCPLGRPSYFVSTLVITLGRR